MYGHLFGLASIRENIRDSSISTRCQNQMPIDELLCEGLNTKAIGECLLHRGSEW